MFPQDCRLLDWVAWASVLACPWRPEIKSAVPELLHDHKTSHEIRVSWTSVSKCPTLSHPGEISAG